MKGFYRHKKGNIYKVLYIAKHSETLEDLVIYIDINNNKIWARPIWMFLEKDRFTKISMAEAYADANMQNYRFPNIEFNVEMPNLIKFNCGFSKSVKAMITLLTNRGIIDNQIFINLKNDDDLERLILHKIKSFKQVDSLEEIFHLIQIWGGISGRVIYVADKFIWNNIVSQYQRLVETCMSISDINETSISKLVGAITQFDLSVQNIGVAFITKHTRFWLSKSLGYNALPIYDSVMANYVMHRKTPSIKHLAEYWNAMITKADEINISLMSLERQIFIYAFDFLRQKEYK